MCRAWPPLDVAGAKVVAFHALGTLVHGVGQFHARNCYSRSRCWPDREIRPATTGDMSALPNGLLCKWLRRPGPPGDLRLRGGLARAVTPSRQARSAGKRKIAAGPRRHEEGFLNRRRHEFYSSPMYYVRMKTTDRLLAIDSSANRLREGIPGIPLGDVQLMRLIRVASLGISACVEPVLRPKGLNESALHTLMIAISGGPQGATPGSLCDQVGQTRANMTRILRVLAKHKLVAIVTDRGDGRRKRVAATMAGRKVAISCADALRPVIRRALDGLSSAEKRVFEGLLRAVIASMSVEERSVAGTA